MSRNYLSIYVRERHTVTVNYIYLSDTCAAKSLRGKATDTANAENYYL